jgi:hypothetical protein
MPASPLEQIILLSKTPGADKKSTTKFPAAQVPDEPTNVDDPSENAEDAPPGVDHDEWKDNEDMHGMGVSMDSGGRVTHGSLKIGHVIAVPTRKGKYVGIHHPTGAMTEPHKNKARAAMDLMGLHHYLPHSSKVKLSSSNVDLVVALASGVPVKEGVAKYGKVEFADPKNEKYPINNGERAKAAWGYINVQKNADEYPLNGVSLSSVRSKIMAACKKFGIDTSSS